MAQLQYIGARYVPVWYHNSVDDTSNWEVNVEYEPLTFVTSLNNHLYLSKKTVPDNIGTPADNTDYWLDMGVFSGGGSIDDLRQEVEALDGRVDDIESDIEDLGDDNIYARLHNKKIIVLGDSLTEGSGSALHNTWCEQMAARYDCTVVNEGLSGSPIGGTSYADSFISRIDAILAANDTCDYFVISGGANDKNRNNQPGSTNTSNQDSLSGALKAIITKVRNKYGKDCQIRCMTTYHRYDDVNTLGYNEYDYVDAMMRASSIMAVPCFNNYNDSGLILIDLSTSNGWMDVGFVDSGVRSYHFSKNAYTYMLPIYSAFIAFGVVNSDSVTPCYHSSGNEFIHKSIDKDGFARVSYKTEASATFSDLGNHFAAMSDIGVTIPKEVGLSWVSSIVATVNFNGWNVPCSVKYFTPPTPTTDNSFQLTISGACIYGSTAPTSGTVRVSVEICGY